MESSFKIRNQDRKTLSTGCLEELNKSAKEYGEYISNSYNRILTPYVVADVNQGEKYEDLRNVYIALALAQWCNSLSSHTRGFTALRNLRPWSPKTIWDKFVYSFSNGEYECWNNTTSMNVKHSVGGVTLGGIKVVNIEGMPPEIKNQVDWVSRAGFINEEKDVLFDNKLHLDSENSGDWYNKGNSLQAQGRYNEAIQAYDEAIRLDPKFAMAWEDKGDALKSIGRTAEADAAYAKAEELGYG